MKTPTSYAVPANIYNIEKKSQKDVVYFQPEDNHETRIAESEKVLINYRLKHDFKITFIFNFLQRRLKR